MTSLGMRFPAEHAIDRNGNYADRRERHTQGQWKDVQERTKDEQQRMEYDQKRRSGRDVSDCVQRGVR